MLKVFDELRLTKQVQVTLKPRLAGKLVSESCFWLNCDRLISNLKFDLKSASGTVILRFLKGCLKYYKMAHTKFSG